MPANPKTLQATEAYRRRVIGIRKSLQDQAKTIWPTIQQFDDSEWPSRMAAAVEQAQTDAVRATSGYLGAVLTLETGVRTAPLPIDPKRYAGLTENGVKLSEAFRSPFIGVLWKLKEGEDYQAALKYGLNRATRMVGVEYDWAHRQSMLDAIAEDDRFVGWTRAVAGTCGACAAAAGGSVSGDLHFEVHPDCQCVSEPEVRPSRSADKVQVVEKPRAGVTQSVDGAGNVLFDDMCLPRPPELQYGGTDSRLALGEYDPDLKIVRIGNISNAEDAASTFVHEYGHWLDLGNQFGFAKQRGGKYFFGKADDVSFDTFTAAKEAREELVDALRKSDAFQAMEREIVDLDASDLDPSLVSSETKFREYLMRDEELVARFFQQWIGETQPSMKASWDSWKYGFENGISPGGKNAVFSKSDIDAILPLMKKYLRTKGVSLD